MAITILNNLPIFRANSRSFNQSFRIIFNNIFIEKDLMDETFLDIQHINISVLEKGEVKIK